MYTDIEEAFNWYSKWTGFKKISRDQTYAQALIKNSDIKWGTVMDNNIELFVSKVKELYHITKSQIQERVNTHRPKFVQYASNTMRFHKTNNVACFA